MTMRACMAVLLVAPATNACALATVQPPPALDAMAAALAGYFLWSALQSPLLRLPTLRDFQRAQGDIVIDWVQARAARSQIG